MVAARRKKKAIAVLEQRRLFLFTDQLTIAHREKNDLVVQNLQLKRVCVLDVAKEESENTVELINLDSHQSILFQAKSHLEKESWLDSLEGIPSPDTTVVISMTFNVLILFSEHVNE